MALRFCLCFDHFAAVYQCLLKMDISNNLKFKKNLVYFDEKNQNVKNFPCLHLLKFMNHF